MNQIRIGHGYDVHRFTTGDHIILGGVKIAHNRSIKAHSDGDVLLHSLCDALLGAAALGDIGGCFPDNDDRYLNIDSRLLLKEVFAMLQGKGYRIANIDITIIAQKPVISPHTMAMKKVLHQELSVALDCINIKATTTEGLGFEGREEGVAVHSVVLINQ